MSRLFRTLVIVLALGLAQQASAGSFRVQFAGAFDAYCYGSGCAGSGLEALAGTAFSGEFVFPDSGVDLAPGDPELGVYDFASLVGTFRFDSVVDAFDVSGQVPVTVGVLNCNGDACAYSDDLVTLSAEFGGFNYDMSLVNYGPVLDLLTSDAIPPLDILQSLAAHPFFSVSNQDYSAYVEALWVSGPDPLTASVTAVPAPPALWLLLTGLAILPRRFARRCGYSVPVLR